MATSSQKFIARNRAPRVQIEYDVELYGAEKKVQLPFVMGVLSDLSGKPAEPLAPVSAFAQASGSASIEAMFAAETAFRTVRLSETCSRSGGGGAAIDPVTIERSTKSSSSSPPMTVQPGRRRVADRIAMARRGESIDSNSMPARPARL